MMRDLRLPGTATREDAKGKEVQAQAFSSSLGYVDVTRLPEGQPVTYVLPGRKSCHLPGLFATFDVSALESCMHYRPPTHPEVQIHQPFTGKIISLPRDKAFYGDDRKLRYRYGALQDAVFEPWPPVLKALRDQLHELLGLYFNTCVVNRYQTGDNYIGWHQDKPGDMHPEIGTLSLSFGATRPFQLGRPTVSPPAGTAAVDDLKQKKKEDAKDTKDHTVEEARRGKKRAHPDSDATTKTKMKKKMTDIVTVRLAHGDVFYLDADTNRDHKHQVPKCKPKDVAGPRWGLTFRHIVGQHEVAPLPGQTSVPRDKPQQKKKNKKAAATATIALN